MYLTAHVRRVLKEKFHVICLLNVLMFKIPIIRKRLVQGFELFICDQSAVIILNRQC